MNKGEPQSLKEILRKFRRNMLPKLKNVSDMAQAWEDIVGSSLGELSRPVSVSSHVLLVEVDSSAVIQELSCIPEKEIKKRIREELGINLKKIRYQLAQEDAVTHE